MNSRDKRPRQILAVAPHPDDETLGCGGTLLRHKAEGADIHCLIVTSMAAGGYAPDAVATRGKEIAAVAKAYGFASVTQLEFAPAQLDAMSKSELVSSFAKTFAAIGPEILYLPFPGDVHSDHAATFSAAVSAAKWFRSPDIRSVRCYETLSETDQAIDPRDMLFRANMFIDISEHLERKLQVLALYPSELDTFPFPRSAEAVRAQAMVRGAACGAKAAESFMSLREFI